VDQPPLPGFAVDGDGHLRRAHGEDGRRLPGDPQAKLELESGYDPAKHGEFFTYFDWRQFSDEEWELCPPVVAVGGDGAMYDIGFQNLSRLMASGKPIKVLVVDTQVYSNTGGQACTSGFVGQISDMAQYGKAQKGKQEARKEIGLIGMAHRTTYVLQGTIANASHMIEGFIRGLKARRPALFNLYSSCQPEHGIGDDMSAHQARLAVESRAYPVFRYDPDRRQDAGRVLRSRRQSRRWTGLADLQAQVPLRPSRQGDGGAAHLRRLRHHRGALPQALPDRAARHLEREHGAAGRVPRSRRSDREGSSPTSGRSTASSSCRGCWSTARSSSRARTGATSGRCCALWPGVGEPEITREEIEADVRRDLAGRIGAALLDLWRRRGRWIARRFAACARRRSSAGTVPAPRPQQGPEPTWRRGSTRSSARLATSACGSTKIFAYNAGKKAYIQNPAGGPYADLVKAAEKCTARVIHPGLPTDRSAKDAAKWIARGEKYN
jgi:pyruvate-ferredoxin/flavodoxin oxidoreductase